MSSFAIGQAITGLPTVVNQNGSPLGSALVGVCTTNPGSGACPVYAILYTDNTLSISCTGINVSLNNVSNPSIGSGCSNPGHTDYQGNVIAFTTTGLYWCQYKGTGLTTYSQPCPTSGSSGSGVSFSTAGQGFFWSNGKTEIPAATISSSSNPLVHIANQVLVFQFTLLASYTIRNIGITSPSGVSVGYHASFGIYDASGNKLIDTGVLSSANMGGFGGYAFSITPVTLSPGVYYFAQTADATTSLWYGIQQTGAGVSIFFPTWNGASVGGGGTFSLLGGVAANASSAGVLPSTLGTISPLNPNSAPFPCVPAIVLFMV